MQQFDPENPEISLFNLYDQELMNIAGTPLFYFECMVQWQGIDQLYREDRSKLWSTCEVPLYGFYDPQSSQNYIDMFGIDSRDEIKIELNLRAVIKAIGHIPKLGSRIFTPHRRENWVVRQRNIAEFRLWSEFRLIIMAERFQESLTTNEGKVTQKQPNIRKLNSDLFKRPGNCETSGS
jgi:hypothetical protein